ncbi:glycoside hydrolase [Clostridium sp. BL-8]|uniref:glycoside hydrolase n=1 Tax=Clostridium sp. BL-8 TaxID=349938 RepID=UPI00098CD14B|nr:glycoside hydrolase [Clostridium sp. BL-8]OOM80676.1 hypothetical protein CLOBL_07090 [Clostridium sp. BL-8]
MRKFISLLTSIILISTTLSACEPIKTLLADKFNEPAHKSNDFTFDVDPSTFEIDVTSDGKEEEASEPEEKRDVSNFKKSTDEVSWEYPSENMGVNIKKEKDYLDVNIKANDVGELKWPEISGDSYILPLWEGKYIPSDDQNWKSFLSGQEMSLLEDFSMQFFAVNKGNYSVLYVMENMFNDKIQFDTKDKISFSLTHEFPSTTDDKEYNFRIYVTSNDPVDIAGIYKDYIKEKGKFTTLEEKAKQNPNIRKLYGSPFIYLWDKEFIAQNNVNWTALRKLPASSGSDWINNFIKKNVEDGTDAATELSNIKTQDYVSDYQKNTIVSAINQALLSKNFYNSSAFPNIDDEGKQLANKGVDNLNDAELYDLNKRALKSEWNDATDDISKWGNGNSLPLLEDINNSGIKNAWLGFSDWTTGLINPEFVSEANKDGYLIAPYDSYHSIQEPGKEQWDTAAFTDSSLYENATITDKDGKKVDGFLGEGRKLNPTLSLPSVENRVQNILNTGIQFNSWFIDCDAAGELYDDYSPDHTTSQEQDMNARLNRMSYIRDDKNMVIGSEEGNDYASQTIAFAQGLETPVIAWSDDDMRKNKNSQYYIGGYYSPNGGVPPIYGKQVPLKDLYKQIYLSPIYSLPLYKLVYNNSVITSHHWEWGSLKIKDEVSSTMLNEILYDTPPFYHLDKNSWNSDKDLILSHLNVWSPFSKKAVTQEMTDFKVLSDDRMVQMTTFGKDLKVVANFSDKEFKYNDDTISPMSLIIYDGDQKTNYTPKAS